MKKCAIVHKDLNSSESSLQCLTSVTRDNNSLMNKQNHVMDLRNLSSRIICSDNISRQNLSNKPSTSTIPLTTDDDDQFYKKIKSEIDKNLLMHSNENYKPNSNYQNINLKRKTRPMIDKETQNVIKRFKKDVNHLNLVQPLNDKNIIQYNCVNNIVKETEKRSTNISNETIIQHTNMFSSDALNTNFRIPPYKYIFQMTSKLQANVLPLVEEYHEEYEEALFYKMIFLTPPNNNSIEDDKDS